MPTSSLVPIQGKSSVAPRPRRRILRWVLASLLILCLIAAIALSIAVRHAEPILRARVIETLSTHFKSKVELDDFHVSLLDGLQVSGNGLRIFGKTDPNSHEPGVQPIIGVLEFRFHAGIWDLFRTPMHVNTVYLKGLQLNIPPKEQRSEMKPFKPAGGKIKIVVDHLISDTAQLVINTQKPGKLPLVFAIQRLRLTRIGSDQPMHFEADLVNPKPIGKIHSSGNFGPWNPDDPRETPVKGDYSFRDADLSTIKGIGGILSSTGRYVGALDRIVVDGTTDTPDFRIAIGGTRVPLHTDFHATVDGTSGDTYLQPVRAKLLNTPILATGAVVRTTSPPGHHVTLDVKIDKGKIEDLLKLALKRNPPMMTGAVQLNTRFDLPPGEPDLAMRLNLAGDFRISTTHFNDPTIQAKVDSLSMRAQGKPKLATDNIPDNMPSDLGGTFKLDEGLLSFSRLDYEVPGARVDLVGQYNLQGNDFDFHGKARMDAKLSHMVGGWKSILLKPVDPFFSKNGAGTEVPVKIVGTKTDMHFGTDFHHKDKTSD
jgi:hypothetical protein